MDNTRRKEIDWFLDHEPREAWTQEWRDDLTVEETAYVQKQDDHYEEVADLETNGDIRKEVEGMG